MWFNHRASQTATLPQALASTPESILLVPRGPDTPEAPLSEADGARDWHVKN